MSKKRRSTSKRRQLAIWASLQFAKWLFNALPHRTAVSLGGALGGTVESFSKTRVEKARARCVRILGVSDEEARNIISGAYNHFGRSLAEFLRMPQMANRLDELVEVQGMEHLQRAFSLGKGVIFFSAHIGCWEYAAAVIARRGFPVNMIATTQRDERITDAIAEQRRCVGIRPMGKGMDLRGAIECLKRGELLAALLDQDAKEAGVISPFLGFPASTPTGPIKLARKLGAPLLPTHIVRNPDGIHMTMRIEPPLEGPDGQPFGEDIQYAVDRCNEIISGWIRRTPQQWMWMYPRWASTLHDR